MDNQKAIKRMESVREYLCAGNPIWNVDEMREAFNMAISALQAQEAKTQLSEEGTTSDLISRQVAIDALAKHEKSNGHNYTLFVDIVSECAEIIRDLPSAQPEPQWIPVSEKLPEDGTDCLVSSRCSDKVIWVDRATYSVDLFTVDKEDFFGNRGESGWYCHDREYGYCKVLNVLAWMPLPEPYRAERRTDGGYHKQAGGD